MFLAVELPISSPKFILESILGIVKQLDASNQTLGSQVND